VLHVKVKDPQFEGQTKTKLGKLRSRGVVKTVVNDAWVTSSTRRRAWRAPSSPRR